MQGANDHFIPLYVDYLRRSSGLATAPDSGPLELAARLFAVASQVVEDHHDLRELPQSPPVKTLQDLETKLSQLDDGISGLDLYACLHDALDLVQTVCCMRHDDGMHGEVEIEAVQSKGDRRLGGRVVYWVRRKRLYRSLRRKSWDDAEGRRPPEWLESPGRHLDRLFCFWRRGNHLPRLERAQPVHSDPQSPLLNEAGLGLDKGQPWRLALCPLIGDAKTCFELVGEGRRDFRTHTTCPVTAGDGHSLREQLEDALKAAAEQEIHLLVFPELTIDLETRDWLCARLRNSGTNLPYGVVAGSFHVDREGITRPYNESLLVDEKGWTLLAHCKAGRFRITGEQLDAATGKGFFPGAESAEALGIGPQDEIQEFIQPGSKLQLLEAASAQIAVLICADAIDRRSRRQMRDLIVQLFPDLVLLPSMSFESGPFRTFEEELQELEVGTLLVNAHCVCEAGETLASVSLGHYEHKGGPPARVRWRKGWPEAERWNRSRKGKTDEWTDYSLKKGEPYAWMADSVGERIGLVVDLSVFCSES